MLCAAPASSHPNRAPDRGHPATCDSRPVTAHVHRTHSLLRSAYSLERWQTGPKRSEIRAAQKHRRCIEIAKTRRQLGALRDRLAERLAAYAAEQEATQKQWGECSDDSPAESQGVRDCIHGAAIEHGVAESWLLRVAVCESQLNPRAANPSGASGLFQFMPGTWASTPYGGHSIWSPRWSALGAAWMFRQGRAGEWVCN